MRREDHLLAGIASGEAPTPNPALNGYTPNHEILMGRWQADHGRPDLALGWLSRPMGWGGELSSYANFVVKAIAGMVHRKRVRRPARRYLDALASWWNLHRCPDGRVVMPGGRLYLLHDEYVDAMLHYCRTGEDALPERLRKWKKAASGYLELVGCGYRPNVHRADLIRPAVPVVYALTDTGWASWLPEGIESPNHAVLATSCHNGAAYRLSPSSGVKGGEDTRMAGPMRAATGLPAWRIVGEGTAQRIDKRNRPLGPPYHWRDSIPSGRPVRAWRADREGVREVEAGTL